MTLTISGTNGISNVPSGDVTSTTTQEAINELAIEKAGMSALTHYHYPTLDGNFRDLYRAGFKPSWFNQQWGGAQWGTLPDGSFGSVATGNVQDNAYQSIGDSAGDYYISQGFKVSESVTNPVIWLKLYKLGNAGANLAVCIYSDNGSGVPNALVGTYDNSISSGRITSKSDGEWYAFTPAPGTLVAGTQYHVVLTTGQAADGVNHYAWKKTTGKVYPHGSQNRSTSAPSWSSVPTEAHCFLIQNPAANSLIQSGGMFGDYKLTFNPGTPVNQSRSLSQPLSNFYDGKNCTVLHRGTYTVSTNVWDFCYGLDHDRITLTIDASGFPILSIYESDRTLHQVTGAASVAAGNHDLAIKVRTVGDGADLAYLYVDGVSVGAPLTAQTFTMDKNLRDLGTARLGDGFGIIPAWTQDMQMTSLPSAQGWTWTGTATEANAMSVSGGKLYQNANGYTSTQYGYYVKAAAFNNATGWTTSFKVRIPSSPNTIGGGTTSVFIAIADATKYLFVMFGDYFVRTNGTTGSSSTEDFIIQSDFKSKDRVITLCGKGSDYYVYIDGVLSIDGAGKLTCTTTTNEVYFGDNSSVASGNADAIWSYVKYYQGGMLLPVANTGTCSEFAHWSGDKSALLPYAWNSGTPVSIKQLCGVEKNYIDGRDAGVMTEVRRGVAANPTYTSAINISAELETFVIGAAIKVSYTDSLANTVAAGNPVYIGVRIDGATLDNSNSGTTPSTAGYRLAYASNCEAYFPNMLHKVDGINQLGSGTTTLAYTWRNLTVEARS